MGKKEHLSQDKINEIWRNLWNSFGHTDSERFFTQRLFVEGYPVFKKYISPNPREILDAGGGTGRYGLHLAQDFPECRVTISDILDESLAIGKRIAGELNIKNIEFKRDDILSSSFPDNKFDIVLSDVVIQHLPDHKKAIRELNRITKPGGRILISANNFWNFHTIVKFALKLMGKYEYGYEKSFTRRGLAKELEKADIKVIATDGFYVGYGLFRLKKYHRSFHFLGRAVNRLAKILDKFTGRFFTKNFGFEILAVGEKRHNF